MRSSKRALAAVVATTLLAASYGSTGAIAAVVVSGSDDPARGVSDDEIRVGGFISAQIPGMDIGTRARLERANAEGGVHGRTFTIVESQDDEVDPAKTFDIVRRLVLDEEVFAVVPIASTTLLPNSTDFMAENKVPFFGWGFMPGYCLPNEWGFGFSGCIYGTSLGLTEQGAGMNTALTEPFVELAMEKDPSLTAPSDVRAVFLNTDDPTAPGNSITYQTLLNGETGPQLLYEDKLPPTGVTDFSPWVNRIVDEDPDIVFLALQFQNILGIKAGLRTAGYDGIVADYATYVPGILGQANIADALEGQYAESVLPMGEDTENPAIQQILADLETIGADPQISLGVSIGYWTADMMVQMVDAVGQNLTPDTFDETVNGGFEYNAPEGGPGNLAWPDGHVTQTPCGGVVQVVDGAYEIVKPFDCYEIVPPIDT